MLDFFRDFKLTTHRVTDGDLRLRTAGSGPPLLLLHGNPQTHASPAKNPNLPFPPAPAYPAENPREPPPMPEAEPLLLRNDQNAIATLTLNRPASRNALSSAMMTALEAEFEAVAADDAVRVLVIQGAGPGFCAGHDLREVRYGDDAARTALFAQCSRMMQRITTLPVPVIARVHGIATAAGCQLVATCDLAIAADTARFAVSGINVGLFCSTPMVALSRAVPRKAALEMLLTGDMIPAEQAARLGLINRAVPEADLDAAVQALAQKIASKSRAAVALGKPAFYRQAELPLAEAYAHTAAVMVSNMQAPDATEGIDAFLQKRPPAWAA